MTNDSTSELYKSKLPNSHTFGNARDIQQCCSGFGNSTQDRHHRGHPNGCQIL